MLFTVYIYINIKHRYLYVCTVYVLGGLGGITRFLGSRGRHLLGGEERWGSDTGRGLTGRGLEGTPQKNQGLLGTERMLGT